MRRCHAGFAAVAMATAGGWIAMSAAFASSGTAEAGDVCTSMSPPAGCHFIQISSRAAPEYEAYATLYDKNKNVVYKWEADQLGGEKAPTWWFIDGDGGSLDVTVHGDNGLPGGDQVEETGLTLDRNYCFHVDPMGDVKYTGDSITGNCTKD